MEDKLNELLILLCRAISIRKIYFTEHPKVVSIIGSFVQRLHGFLVETKSQTLFVGIIDGNLVYEGRNLVGPSIVGRPLVLFAEKMKCGGVSFSRNTSIEEFKEFIGLASELREPAATLKGAGELLLSRGVTTIELAHRYVGAAGPMGRDQQAVWEGQDSGNFLHSPILIYQALFDAVAQAHSDVASGSSIDIDHTRSVSEYMLHFTRSQFSDLMQHVHYPDFDSYVVGHSVRVAAIAVYFANSFRWSEEVLLEIGTAGLLHDIGKSRIPNEILYKPGRLNSKEFTIMMSHSQIGAEILLGQQDTTRLDIAAAWGHHLRNDGSGYPQKRSWTVRHPLISLLQICDVFEALTAARPYKPILTPHMAYCVMLQDKGGFHPGLLASFIRVIGLYPPGNKVKIDNGTRGIVVAVTQKIDRPVVLITNGPDGVKLAKDKQYQVDLSSSQHRHLSVESLILPEKIE